MIDKIVGLIFLPVSILLFLNIFGVTDIQSIFGIDMLLIAAISLIIVQVSNVIGAHHANEHVKKSYVLCAIAVFPSIIYFFALGGGMPESVIVALPAMLASFIFVEGIYSFYW